jgi:hypothetical protein
LRWVWACKIHNYGVYESMDLSTADGALKGLHTRLTTADCAYLEEEFRRRDADWYSWIVADCGQHIWNSLTAENAFDSQLNHFHEVFCALLKSPTVAPNFRFCCDHHEDQFDVLRDKLAAKDHKWIDNLLDVMAGISGKKDDLKALLPGMTIDKDNTIRLSRFMPLKRFISCHTMTRGRRSREEKADDMAAKLTPKCPAHERHELLLERKEFGVLNGDLGSYPEQIGKERRIDFCDGIKPFSTFSEKVNAKCPDKSSVETILLNLGVPFDKNQVWIELTFTAQNAAIAYRGSRRALFCPTIVDARGNWAFRPDRAIGKNGFARNIKTGEQGMPEVVHKPVPIKMIEDAIVWPKTKVGWGRGSIYA